jgi:hypothetical protein
MGDWPHCDEASEVIGVKSRQTGFLPLRLFSLLNVLVQRTDRTPAQQNFFGCNPNGYILTTTGKAKKTIPGYLNCEGAPK